MCVKSSVPYRRTSRLAKLAPWLLLWVAAPMPLWLALLMSALMGGR